MDNSKSPQMPKMNGQVIEVHPQQQVLQQQQRQQLMQNQQAAQRMGGTIGSHKLSPQQLMQAQMIRQQQQQQSIPHQLAQNYIATMAAMAQTQRSGGIPPDTNQLMEAQTAFRVHPNNIKSSPKQNRYFLRSQRAPVPLRQPSPLEKASKSTTPIMLSAAAQGGDSKFTRFPDLPPELRVEIWVMSIQDARIVRIQKVYPSKLKGICENPAVLHVNREARCEGLQVYKPVFSTRLLHPVYFNFAEDFLVFDDESSTDTFENFMNIYQSGPKDPEQEAERQMMHSELRNLVFSCAKSWDIRRELDEFCNLKNLIVARWEWRTPNIQFLHLEWAKKIAQAERPKTNMHLGDYFCYTLSENRAYWEKLEADPSLLDRWRTKTRILCWHKDKEFGKSCVGSFTQFNPAEMRNNWGRHFNWKTDERLSRMLEGCAAPCLMPYET